MKYHYPLISFHKTINEFSREMRTNWFFLFRHTNIKKKTNVKIRTVDWERYIKENCFKRLNNIAIHFSETCIWKEKKNVQVKQCANNISSFFTQSYYQYIRTRQFNVSTLMRQWLGMPEKAPWKFYERFTITICHRC